MAWQSPYRGEEPLLKLSPRARNVVSRAVLLVIGIGLTWVSVGTFRWIADGNMAYPNSGTTYVGHRRSMVPALLVLIIVVSGFVGVTAVIAAVLPLRAMHAFFDRWYRPPVTGERDVDFYTRWRRWWWWR